MVRIFTVYSLLLGIFSFRTHMFRNYRSIYMLLLGGNGIWRMESRDERDYVDNGWRNWADVRRTFAKSDEVAGVKKVTHDTLIS